MPIDAALKDCATRPPRLASHMAGRLALPIDAAFRVPESGTKGLRYDLSTGDSCPPLVKGGWGVFVLRCDRMPWWFVNKKVALSEAPCLKRWGFWLSIKNYLLPLVEDPAITAGMGED